MGALCVAGLARPQQVPAGAQSGGPVPLEQNDVTARNNSLQQPWMRNGVARKRKWSLVTLTF